MKLLISYDPYQTNWYVGELYKFFHNYLENKNIHCSYVSIKDLAKIYDEPCDYNNQFPSIFSIYSLIITNIENQTSFVHNMSDYAPLILEHKTAIDKLDIKCFSMCSNLTANIISNYPKYKIIPSFYILENWNDYNLINNTSNQNYTKNNKCYFNGLPYGNRQYYINQLKNHPFFDIKDKTDKTDFRSKEQYYKDLSCSRYGLSLNGAAKICYRDLELFGIGCLNLREPLNILTKDPISANVHYKIVIDKFIEDNIYLVEKQKEIIDRLLFNINSISIEEEKYILYNAKQWFLNNVNPNNQIKFLETSLIENNII